MELLLIVVIFILGPTRPRVRGQGALSVELEKPTKGDQRSTLHYATLKQSFDDNIAPVHEETYKLSLVLWKLLIEDAVKTLDDKAC